MSLVFEALQRLEGDRAGHGFAPLAEPAELFRRSEHHVQSRWQSEELESDDESAGPVRVHRPRLRAVGVPLQAGGGRMIAQAAAALTIHEVPDMQMETDGPLGADAVLEPKAPAAADTVVAPVTSEAAGSALATMAADGKQIEAVENLGGAARTPEDESPVQHAVNVLCEAIPTFLQNLVPLFDGSALTNAGGSLQQSNATQLELVTVEGSLVELKTQHSSLRECVAEQNASILRAEVQLQAVREATDRNTQEQSEMAEELRGVGGRITVLAAVGFGLLTVSIVLDVLLMMHPHLGH